MGTVHHRGGWSPERVALLKKLWLAGKSAYQIACILGEGVTRNGVIGKVHRLGMSQAQQPVSLSQKVKKPTQEPRRTYQRPSRPNNAVVAAETAPRPLAPDATPAKPRVVGLALRPLAEPEGMRRVSLVDLERGACRFPLAGAAGEQVFCGLPRHEPSSYCEAHYQACKGATLGRRNSESELRRSLRRYI